MLLAPKGHGTQSCGYYVYFSNGITLIINFIDIPLKHQRLIIITFILKLLYLFIILYFRPQNNVQKIVFIRFLTTTKATDCPRASKRFACYIQSKAIVGDSCCTVLLNRLNKTTSSSTKAFSTKRLLPCLFLGLFVSYLTVRVYRIVEGRN